MSKLRAVLLTSDGLRHRYAARQLHNGFDLVGVLCETKVAAVRKTENIPTGDLDIMEKHLSERDEVEQKLLGENSLLLETDVFKVPAGGSNSLEVFQWVQRHRPDVVLLYGTSIIKPPLLNFYEGKMINMHLGLSPYYRGSGTNFWPLVDRLPECVGVTIHLAIPAVDAGPILTQVRPEIEPTDRAHEIGLRAIIAGLRALQLSVPLYIDGQLEPVSQDLSRGRVCRRKDFNAEAVRQLWGQFNTGMILEYVEQQDERRRLKSIIEQV